METVESRHIRFSLKLESVTKGHGREYEPRLC